MITFCTRKGTLIEYHTNIESALKVLRPTDKIVKILSNKFALVETMFTDGTFDKVTICSLDNNKIYFHGYFNKNLTMWVKNTLESTPRFTVWWVTLPYNKNFSAYRYKPTYHKTDKYKRNLKKVLKYLQELK